MTAATIFIGFARVKAADPQRLPLANHGLHTTHAGVIAIGVALAGKIGLELKGPTHVEIAAASGARATILIGLASLTDALAVSVGIPGIAVANAALVRLFYFFDGLFIAGASVDGQCQRRKNKGYAPKNHFITIALRCTREFGTNAPLCKSK